MKNETYNGWTNYATWRINLEYDLSNFYIDIYDLGDIPEDIDDIIYNIKEHVEEHLSSNCNNDTTLSYAMAFIDDVNWYEIATHIQERATA
jgi:hypothetical protein